MEFADSAATAPSTGLDTVLDSFPADTIDTPAVTLDNMVGLVEKAARIVDYLQKENAVLAGDLKDYQTALQSATMKASMLAERIRALESEAGQLREDAHWWRWFHAKYHNSTFFNHVEREYAADHPSTVANDASNGDAIAA